MLRKIIFALILTLGASLPGFAQSPAQEKAWQERYQKDRARRDRLFAAFAAGPRAQGLEVIVVGSTLQQMESVFGHSAIRFVGSGAQPTEDLVISYGADVNESQVSGYQGIAGGYRMDLGIFTFGEFILDNNGFQNRFIDRYIVPARAEQIERLTKILQADYRDKDKKYSFLSNNCTSALVAALQKAGFDVAQSTIHPKKLPQLLQASALAPFPPLTLLPWAPGLKSLRESLKTADMNRVRQASYREYLRWVLIDRESIAKSGRTFEVYQNHPDGDPQAVSLATIYGVWPVASEYYGQKNILWAQDPIFKSRKSEFCLALGTALYGNGFKTKNEGRQQIIANYQNNCLAR